MGTQPVRLEPIVLLEGPDVLDLLAPDEARITGIDHFDLAQHLPDDHLDVLVVDAHALEAVDLLDLVDDVLRELSDALQAQDVVRGRGPSETISPFSTCSPSNTPMLRHLGMSVSTGARRPAA
jgi:hypothetical protein